MCYQSIQGPFFVTCRSLVTSCMVLVGLLSLNTYLNQWLLHYCTCDLLDSFLGTDLPTAHVGARASLVAVLPSGNSADSSPRTTW